MPQTITTDQAAAAASRVIPFYQSGAFWITVILMPLVYMVSFMVLWPNNNFSTEAKIMVITSITGLTVAIAGFWLAASYQSAKKDEATSAVAATPTTVVNNTSPAPSIVNTGDQSPPKE